MCHLYKIVHGFIDFPNAPLAYKPCTNHFALSQVSKAEQQNVGK